MSIRPSIQLIVVGALVGLALYGFVQRNQHPQTSLMTQDDRYVYILHGSAVLKLQKSDLKPAARTLNLRQPEPIRAPDPLPVTKPIESFAADNHDVRDTLRLLFKDQGISYSVAPEVQGTVSVNLENVSLDNALRAILSQAKATFIVEGGVYQISHFPDLNFGPDPTDNVLVVHEDDSLMIQDRSFLYILQDNKLNKVQTSDLKVVASVTID